MKPGRRSEYEIYWEILSFCRSGQTFTQIIGRCDLNSKIAQDYIDFLSGKEYVAKSAENGRNIYRTTQKGKEYLALFTKLYQQLFDNSPEFKL